MANLIDLHRAWKQLGDVPVTDYGMLDRGWGCEVDNTAVGWPKGTNREDIWHWFEAQHPDFIVGEVINGLSKMVSEEVVITNTGEEIRILDKEGEIVTWVNDEWVEDPSVVGSIVNAVVCALTDGPEVLRFRIGK